MARPTRSAGLYAQCVGRGTRLYPGKKDCLILDFVDLSTLSLCTLPSLFGAPRDLDLRGGDVLRAKRIWDDIVFDRPGFELEAGTLTLEELQDRAQSFDPLTLEVQPEVRAISPNAWFSLGRHGIVALLRTSPGLPERGLGAKTRQPRQGVGSAARPTSDGALLSARRSRRSGRLRDRQTGTHGSRFGAQ